MSGPKRTPDQIKSDRAEVASRYLKGDRQVDIAGDLGITQQQISYDLKQIRKAWLESALVDFDQMKALQLARIDNLELEFWEAWERSKESFRKTVTEGRGTADQFREKRPEQAKQVVTIEDRIGDPRYLAGIQWCIAERNKIFGFYAPLKQHHTGSMASYDPRDLTTEQLERIVAGDPVDAVIAA